MNGLERGNRVASAFGIGVYLGLVATWLPGGRAFETDPKLNADRQSDLRLNDREALQ
jgi:hypothetical protein